MADVSRPGRHLRSIREAAGIKREAVCGRAGVSLDTLKGLEAGRLVGVRVGTLARVALALGLAVSEVWPELAARPARPGLIQEAERGAARAASGLEALAELRGLKPRRGSAAT